MKVIAKKGTRCPMERPAVQYITDNNSVDVKPSQYIRRMLADGSLILVEEPAPPGSTNAETGDAVPEEPVKPQKTRKKGGKK